MRQILLPVLLFALSMCCATATSASPKLKEGAYRVDWNRKVVDLCVDTYTNDDLSARDWQGVMAAQGIICRLSEVRETASGASWTGRCSQPGVGRVLDVTYRVTLRVEKNRERFEFLTVISGDQQANIPLRGQRLASATAGCPKDMPFLRPWQ